MVVATSEVCAHCGARMPVGALLVHADEAVFGALSAIISGDVDDFPCGVCGRQTGITPSVLVTSRLDRGLRLFVPPESGWELSDLETHFPERFPQLVIRRFASLHELRKDILASLRARLRVFQEWADSEDFTSYFAALTPEVFAAAVLAVKRYIPGATLEFACPEALSAPPTVDDAIRLIGRCQARLWVKLALAWSRQERGQDERFDDDIDTHVVKGCVVPGALEALREALREAQKQEPFGAFIYSLEALHACACVAAEEENPRQSEWGIQFIAFERRLLRSPSLEPWRLSERRAQMTNSYQGVWDGVSSWMSSEPKAAPEVCANLAAVGARAGFPDIVLRVQQERVSLARGIGVDDIILRLEQAGGQAPIHALLAMATAAARGLVEATRVDDLIRLADGLVSIRGADDVTRATVDAWLGRYLKEARAPKPFLERVGERPRGFESRLPAKLRASLLAERSNAMRLLGRPADALHVIREAMRLLGGDPSSRDANTLRLNEAILLRETGELDTALAIIADLKNLVLEPGDRISLLETSAATLTFVGNFVGALHDVREARSLARGPQASRRTYLTGVEASLRAFVGSVDRALDLLKEIDLPECTDGPTVLSILGAWVLVLQVRPQSLSAARTTLSALAKRAVDVRKEAEAAGVAEVVVASAQATAQLAETIGSETAHYAWEDLYRVSTEWRGSPEPTSVIATAASRYAIGDVIGARERLGELSAAVGRKIGQSKNLGDVLGATRVVRSKLQDLAGALILESAPWHDVRLITESARDVGSRLARRRRGSGGGEPTAPDLSEERLGELGERLGHLFVMDWLDQGDRFAAFGTEVTADGKVESRWLRAPPRDPVMVGRRLRSRLSNWWSSRPGDPFDMTEWKALEEWLSAEVMQVPPGAHIVFVQQPEFRSVPWHVALDGLRTCSYVTSWWRLLDLVKCGRVSESARRIGILSVPRFAETDSVSDAIRGFTQRARMLPGIDLDVCDGTDADRDAARKLANGVDLLVFLCHGFISETDGEAAWMVASDNRLPLAHSVAANAEEGRAHRLGWREVSGFERTPPIVLSAACSSARALENDLGDSLGLDFALRQAGTRCFVAPMWDIVAGTVLPILGNVLGRLLEDNRSPVGDSVRTASVEAAAAGTPRWLAHSLTIHGDWR